MTGVKAMLATADRRPSTTLTSSRLADRSAVERTRVTSLMQIGGQIGATPRIEALMSNVTAQRRGVGGPPSVVWLVLSRPDPPNST